MKGQENLSRARSRMTGTLSARGRAVALALVAFGTASVHSSCLLGRQVDFSEGGLPPLTPPAVLEETSSPRPSSLVILDENPVAQDNNATLEFRVDVFESNPLEDVIGRWFIDRPRPCTENACRGTELAATNARGDAGVRTVRQTVTFRGTRRCHTLDLYVSSEFDPRRDPEFDVIPARTGDIAHVRWFVWVRDADNPTETPRWDLCPVCTGHVCNESTF